MSTKITACALSAAFALSGCIFGEDEPEVTLPTHTIENVEFTGIHASGTHVNGERELVVEGFENFSCRGEGGEYAGVFTSVEDIPVATGRRSDVIAAFVDTSTGVYSLVNRSLEDGYAIRNLRNDAREHCFPGTTSSNIPGYE